MTYPAPTRERMLLTQPALPWADAYDPFTPATDEERRIQALCDALRDRLRLAGSRTLLAWRDAAAFPYPACLVYCGSAWRALVAEAGQARAAELLMAELMTLTGGWPGDDEAEETL